MFRLDITKNVFTGRVVKHWHGLCWNHFLWRCSGNYQIQDLAQWSSCSVIGQMLNSVILEVFSNIYESIILCLRQLRSEKMKCWHVSYSSYFPSHSVARSSHLFRLSIISHAIFLFLSTACKVSPASLPFTQISRIQIFKMKSPVKVSISLFVCFWWFWQGNVNRQYQ